MTTEEVNAVKRKGDEAFVKGGREAEAIEHYTNALDLAKDLKGYDDRQRSKMYSSRAECYLRLQDYEKSIADCTESLKRDRSNFKAQFRRAKAYAQLNQNENAINDLKLVVQKDSENTQAKDLLKELESKVKSSTSTDNPQLTTSNAQVSTVATTTAEDSNTARKAKRLDSEPDVVKEDQDRICDYNILNKKKIELEDEIALTTKEINNLEAAESMLELLLDEDSVRLQMGGVFFAIGNEKADEFAKLRLKELKARRGVFAHDLEEIVEQMKKFRAMLKTKFKDRIGLPEIEPSENAGKEEL